MFITAVVAVVVIMATKLSNAHAGVRISDGASENSSGRSSKSENQSSAYIQSEKSAARIPELQASLSVPAFSTVTDDVNTKSVPADLHVEDFA